MGAAEANPPYSKGKVGSCLSQPPATLSAACFTSAKSQLCVCKTPTKSLTVGYAEMKCLCLPLSLPLAWCKALCSPWKTFQWTSGCSAGFCSACSCSIPSQDSPWFRTVLFFCHATAVFSKNDQRPSAAHTAFAWGPQRNLFVVLPVNYKHLSPAPAPQPAL